MNTKSKILNLLALVVMLSMVATTVSAQPGLAPTQELARVDAVDVAPFVASDEAAASVSTAKEGPPQPELVLTDPYVSEPVAPADTTGLPPAPTVDPYTGVPRETLGRTYLPKEAIGAPAGSDAVVQRALAPNQMPPTIVNFEGIDNRDSLWPPDTDGQVGPNHYVQMINVSTAVYDKQGNLLYGPFHPNELWPETPEHEGCYNTNDGDVVVLYDQMADRWLLTQFGLPHYPVGPWYQCIAVSKGPEPTNDPDDWYPYTFLVSPDKMNDYPKLGVWPDGYYMTANQYADDPADASGAGAWVFERDNMLNGEAATFQYFDIAEWGYWGLLPSNLMGDTLPPVGAPNYFASVDQDWYGTQDIFHIFEFHTDWDNPANSTFRRVTELVVAPFDDSMCDGARSCIPQPDTDQGLDAISDRLMMHLWYRNFGDHESLVVNHTVDVGDDHAGIRWYEIREPGSSAYIHQQSTFAPDEHHRWMGSIAMDKVGNMALGYSIASETMYPSIRYTGRLAGDPLGEMNLGEGVIITGTGSQTGAARWGDYSAMSVDPVDDCTFWYTQEYVETTGSASWQTRIAAFRFPSCLAATGRLEGVVESAADSTPINHAKVTAAANPAYVAYSQADGSYGFHALPADTYTMTVSAYGFQPKLVPGVSVVADATATQDVQLTPDTSYVVSGTVTDDTNGWPLYAPIDIENYPYSPIWNDPASGYYSVTLSSAMAHTLTVSAWVAGYGSALRPLGLLMADATENFALTADLGTCAAPGYGPSSVSYAEDFEASGVYTHTGVADDWEWGMPAIWPYECASGDSCWGTDLDGNYNNNADYALYSPIITLTNYVSGTILTANWWQAWSTERGFDYTYAEVSIDGGPWTEMWRGDGRRNNWTQVRHDISAAAGGNVQFRWRLTSDSGVNMEGYYVDDVEITVGCVSNLGSLLVGNVYSATMTTEALPGATIVSDLGEKTTAMETPRDPNVDDSFYTMFSPSGSHAFTATLRGYGPDSATVVLGTGTAVRQDFYLSAPQMYVVSGTIADATSGWPLYASITVEGDTFWNDPATGYYSTTLPEAFPYVVEVEAWVDGYATAYHQVGPLTADATENIGLIADPVACSAPGYVYNALFYESFEGVDFPPDGWIGYDADGAEEAWKRDSEFAHFGGASALHDYGPQDHMEDGWLVTPAITPTVDSDLTFWENIDWADYVYKHSLLVCTADCDSPPTNYTEIVEFTEPVEDTWIQQMVDLSAYAGTPIRLAFRYEGDWADTWWIDDVVVSPTSCDLMSGGLVVGNVTDENTSQGIVGAGVTNDGGYAATTGETPDDPDVDEGFYTLFSPAGSYTFTATMAYYQPGAAAVTVVQSDTVTQDFVLSAGQLTFTIDSPEVTLPMGVSATVSLTLTNTGGVPFQFELAESPGAFVPLLLTLQGQDRASVQQDGVPPYATPEHVERIRLSASPIQDKPVTAPWPPTGDVHLVLDDGSLESNVGLTAGGQFIWLNRFTPDPADFPFVLDQVSVLFSTEVGVNISDTIDIYLYEDIDGDGDPGTGASLLQSLDDAAVQAADSVTWSNYPVDPPVTLNGPGDVLIAVVNRTAGVAAGDHPAAQDQTESQGRSWVGFYTTGDPPDPPVLPPDQWGVIDDFGLPGNWMVRGSGHALAPDVPWLSEDPISGTVVTDQVVDITFDAGEVDQPGEHHAQLRIWNDTPYAMPNVYLTMTVSAPASWGRLAGTVSSLGHCDVNMAGLEGAEVLVDNGTTVSTTTYADGTYVYWLEAGSYTVTISADGHVAADPAQVTISAGVTTTLNVEVRSIEPCISVAPLSMEAAPPLGSSETQALMLTNAGAGASTVSIQESPAAIWLSEEPTAGTVGADSTFPVTVTFTNLPAVMPGIYTSSLVVNTQDAVNSQVNVPVTITIAPRPEPSWEKLVSVNDVLTDTFPAIVVADDIVEIVDQVWITWTGGVTFTLDEEWSDSLELLDYAVRGLPGGTAILPDYGTVVMPAAGQMTVMVTDGPGEWGYVITKTFIVLAGNWETGAISETLLVEGAAPQLDPKVLQFVNGAPVTKVYLPLVMRSG